jgi:hypothetical protein
MAYGIVFRGISLGGAPPYETHWGSLGGYTERAESLFIAARIHERKLSLCHLPLDHDPERATTLDIGKTHYAGG